MTVTTAPVPAARAAPIAPLGWARSLRTAVAWNLAELRTALPSLVVVQLLGGVGFVIGFGLFFRHLPVRNALFVSTGVPVINLVIMGVVVAPQNIATQKLTQSYDFLMSLPVRRSVRGAAAYVIILIIGVPSVVVTLLVAVPRYHLHLEVNPGIVAAVLFVALSGTLIGLAIGHAIERPNLTQNISQLIIFMIFGFSPVSFPASHLPRWLADVNTVLPFESMATLTRAGLTSGLVSDVARAYLVVAGWTVISIAVAGWAMGRRR